MCLFHFNFIPKNIPEGQEGEGGGGGEGVQWLMYFLHTLTHNAMPDTPFIQFANHCPGTR